MRIFLYEFVTGGGFLADTNSAELAGALLPEARAMITALTQDFLVLLQQEPCNLHVLRAAPYAATLFHDLTSAKGVSQASPRHSLTIHDVTTPAEEQSAFARLAGECEWTVLIAPESAGHLLRRAEAVLSAGGKLLGASPAFIALTANKQHTAQRLSALGVPVPEGRLLAPNELLPADFKYPAVLKPVAGCGSQGVRLVKSAADVPPSESWNTERRLEHFHPGEPCSMAALCSDSYTYPLQLFRQTLSADGEFRYLGGAYAFDENKENRARRLVKAALKALPPALGYVGFDLVLGSATDGRHDVVIEVNPRLTTSYLGQRQVFLTNLPHMLLETVAGRWPNGRFSTRKKFAFDTSGTITPL